MLRRRQHFGQRWLLARHCDQLRGEPRPQPNTLANTHTLLTPPPHSLLPLAPNSRSASRRACCLRLAMVHLRLRLVMTMLRSGSGSRHTLRAAQAATVGAFVTVASQVRARRWCGCPAACVPWYSPVFFLCVSLSRLHTLRQRGLHHLSGPHCERHLAVSWRHCRPRLYGLPNLQHPQECKGVCLPPPPPPVFAVPLCRMC